MKRLDAIEGLRGWLAWAVVLSHCVEAADLQRFGLPYQIFWGGHVAVVVFVIISGFVITHLVLEKNETYAPYIVRRFMRIFPLFLVACILGAATLHLYTKGLAHASWSSTAATEYGGIESSQVEHLWTHMIAHLVMLHGTIPDNILSHSQYAFSPPAWSLSLEWQFYLIAPFVILLARKPNGAASLAACCWFGAYLFFHRKFGVFQSASFLPGAAPAFAIGIASRLLWPILECKITRPLPLALVALALTAFASFDIISVLIWIALFSFECADRTSLKGIDGTAMQIYDMVFRSALPLYWGTRSYSVYLCHFSVLSIAVYGVTAFVPTISQWPFLCFILICTVVGTGFTAALAYSLVEKPGIAFGRIIASALTARSRRKSLPQMIEAAAP